MMQAESVLNTEKCFEIIKKNVYLNYPKNKNFHFKFTPRSEFEGFLGQYYNLNVSFKNKRNKREYLDFFVKLPPIDGPQNNFVEEGDCFKIELGLYVKIFPKLQLSKERQLIPKCFLGFDNCLVLEEMVNFKCLDKFDFFSFEHCTVVMKSIARFHAKSIIFEEKKKITVLELCWRENIKINLNDCTFQSTLDYFVKNLLHLIDNSEEIDEKEKRMMYRKKIETIALNHFKHTSPINKEINVLVHADLWTNNILFKYQNEKVKQCCIVDFQMARYCAPAYDLLYFLYSTTSENFRQEKMDSLLLIYHQTLEECLMKEANLNVNLIFPFEDLKKSVSKIEVHCMIQAFSIMSVTLLGHDASFQRINEKMPLTNIVVNEFKNEEKYKFRIMDNLFDLYKKLDDFDC
ncbi:uncharacterized protein LOC122507944 [Leptopilina heterotoma]|uniref:uncharacterized protein LOC122507944 n=1 Tax=Leptopilina heterotoma TaxID=63436 RepID=UPI001CA8DC8B|nr:uncharacterized protein LOC122507944 [Leptopilina heterotoma]